MRTLAISVMLASTVLAAPAVAQDSGWYAGVEAGFMRAQDIDLDYHDRLNNFEDVITVGHKIGWDADIIGGYDFGPIRTEAEISRKRASIDEVYFGNALAIPGSSNVDGRGSARLTSAMGNILFDFGSGGWRGYVGGGFGMARVKYSAFNSAGTAGFADTDDVGAWQGIAGVGREITPNLELGLKYRYFHTLSMHFDNDSTVAPFNVHGARLISHSVLASLIYNFRAPPAPPAPPVPPPPPPPSPPPPATQTCPDGSVILATDDCPVPPPPPPPPPPAPERG